MSSQREILCEGKHLRLVRENAWEFAQRKRISGIVGIVAVTDEGRMLLVEQFRPPVGKRVIELPAGLAGDTSDTAGEPLAEAARRELLEETGYTATRMTFLAEGPPTSGMTDEIITLFYAEELRKEHAGGGDQHEDITVYEIPVAELPTWLEAKRREGVLIDLRIYNGLYFHEKRAKAGE